MKRHLLSLIAIFIIYPYIVGFSTDSTNVSPWSLLIGIGGGNYSYVTRDCSGNVTGKAKIPLKDIGGGLEYSSGYFVGGVKGGLVDLGSASVINNPTPENYYYDTTTFQNSYIAFVNPYAGLRFRYFELSIGGVMLKTGGGSTFSREAEKGILPNGYIRIGSEKGLFVSASLFYNMPAFSGGGIFDIGAGVCLDEQSSTSVWGGLGVIDLENSMTLIKFSTDIYNKSLLTVTGGFGSESKAMMFSATLKARIGF